MRHGSLFSGIGGFDLAAEWMGWENVFHCEWNPFGQRVLHHYWPNAETFTDITKTDFTKYANTVDILTGGFPCQPYSSAGKRLGKEDERHLWPEMLRAIREISPSFVVGENVRGLTNWNGGLVFDEVCTELESYGYSVAPVIIPACGVNAPHRRERIWFIAYADGNAGRRGPCESRREERETSSNGEPKIYTRPYTNGKEGNASDPKRDGLEHWNKARNLRSEETTPRGEGSTLANDFKANGNGNTTNSNSARQQTLNSQKPYLGEQDRAEALSGNFIKSLYTRKGWESFPTQSPICGGDDGIPRELDGITFSKWRTESIKAYGNAIVPQVAYEIFKAITKTT